MGELLGAVKFSLTAVTDTTVGGVAKIVNPEGADLFIERLVLEVTTGSTGACTVDAGVDDGGDVNADNLIDGKSVATAGVFDNIKDAGTNGKNTLKWKAGEYLVITASATAAGLKGNGYVKYFRA